MQRICASEKAEKKVDVCDRSNYKWHVYAILRINTVPRTRNEWQGWKQGEEKEKNVVRIVYVTKLGKRLVSRVLARPYKSNNLHAFLLSAIYENKEKKIKKRTSDSGRE